MRGPARPFGEVRLAVPAEDQPDTFPTYRIWSAGCPRRAQFDFDFVRLYTVSTAFPSRPSGMMLYAVIVK